MQRYILFSILLTPPILISVGLLYHAIYDIYRSDYKFFPLAKREERVYNKAIGSNALPKGGADMRAKDAGLMERIKRYAEEYILKTGRSPSTTKIADAVGVSRGTAYKYLVAMSERNMIKYDGGTITTDATVKLSGAVSRAAIVGSIPCGSPEEEQESVEAYVPLPAEIFGEGSF